MVVAWTTIAIAKSCRKKSCSVEIGAIIQGRRNKKKEKKARKEKKIGAGGNELLQPIEIEGEEKKRWGWKGEGNMVAHKQSFGNHHRRTLIWLKCGLSLLAWQGANGLQGLGKA